MLRAFSPRKGAIRPFICLQCLARIHQDAGSHQNWPAWTAKYRSASQTSPNVIKGPLRNYTTRRVATLPPGEPRTSNPRSNTNTRKRLRQWEKENISANVVIEPPRDLLQPGMIANYGTRTPTASDIEYDEDDTEDRGGVIPRFDQNDLINVSTSRVFLLAGDLVELTFRASHLKELAIYIRDVDGQGQYYTMSGQWAHLTNNTPKFFVPDFVRPSELSELVPFLPESVSSADMDEARPFANALPRNVGKKLLTKMASFLDEADTAYFHLAQTLETAHKQIAHQFLVRYATLEKIADVLLAPVLPKQGNESYPKPVLYALHRRLLLYDIGIQIPKRGSLRAGGEYEILPSIEVDEVYKVADMVRTYTENKARGLLPSARGPLHKFIARCQYLIDASREYRQFTPFGTIGPSAKLETSTSYRTGSKQAQFTALDTLIIRFIESWCALDSFNRTSSLHCIAPAILRATERYEDVDLLHHTGWTFLQEIGAIPPWETRAPYQLKMPYSGRRLQMQLNRTQMGFTEDKLANIRKDWGDLPVFCIDDTNAHQIDDGISIEHTAMQGEYWVHIHIANPTSHIDPESGAREHAEAQMETTYMIDRVEFMLDPEFVTSKASLAPGRPCLTFSGKINLNGDLLEHKIVAGTINNVVYITPATLDEVASGTAGYTSNEDTYTVGSATTKTVPSRQITQTGQLSAAHREMLKIIHKLGFSRSMFLQARGGMFKENQFMEISVDFNGVHWSRLIPTHSVHHYGDPTITVTKSTPVEAMPFSPVPYIMLLGNEIAARWCSERGIPTIYRVTPYNPAKMSPTEYFKNIVLPSQDEDGNAPQEVLKQYAYLLGSAQLSTIPGPHLAVGADMLSRCTSPLRRFPDMLVHWQIGAALQEEHRLGHSLIGNRKDDFVPFSKAQLDALLPRIDTRERCLKGASETSKLTWFTQFLVRAWHFGEAELPSSLTLTVGRINISRNFGIGIIREFLIPGRFYFPEWPDALQEGDLLEVKIRDVTVLTGWVWVDVIRRKDVLETDIPPRLTDSEA